MGNCYICNGRLELFGTIPFDHNSNGLPVIDKTPMKYYQCSSCGFLCCPTMLKWSIQRLAEKVYTEDYAKLDMGYSGERATNWTSFLTTKLIPRHAIPRIRHLDYGSGEGHLSKMLKEEGFDTSFYDPFSSPTLPEGRYNLVTAVEVAEHSTNIFDTLEDIKKYLTKDGVLALSTHLVTKETDITWWYIGARCGHIGMHTEKSLSLACKKVGLYYYNLNSVVHIIQKDKDNLTNLTKD